MSLIGENLNGLESPTRNEPVPPWKWTIDRERELYFISLGGQGYGNFDIPSFYVLIWKNKIINMEAFSKTQGDFNSGVEIWWKITKVENPQSLRVDVDQKIIIEFIKEAFDAHGTIYKRDVIKKVNFDYIATLSP